MNNHAAGWMLSLLSLLAGCAVSSVEPLSVPLAYQSPPNPEAMLVSVSCPAIRRIEVVDRRAEKLLGVRVHESKPLRADVSAGNDPAPWARDGVEQFMSADRVKFGAAGPELVLELDALRTVENIWHRAGYEARVSFGAALRSPQGKVCWQETVEGKAGNYGYAGSIENYRETLNSALDAASLHLLDSAGFNEALCHCAD